MAYTVADGMSAFASMGMGGKSTEQQLSEEELLARKKKLMAAGSAYDTSPMNIMFGNALNSAGTPRT